MAGLPLLTCGLKIVCIKIEVWQVVQITVVRINNTQETVKRHGMPSAMVQDELKQNERAMVQESHVPDPWGPEGV